jgi:hypothetical protein
MRIEDRLSDKDKKKIAVLPKKEDDKLSRRDILELMGTKRDTYKRVKGAIRRK